MRNPKTENALPFRSLSNIQQVSELTDYGIGAIRTEHYKPSRGYFPTYTRPLLFPGRVARYGSYELYAWSEKVAAERTSRRAS